MSCDEEACQLLELHPPSIATALFNSPGVGHEGESLKGTIPLKIRYFFCFSQIFWFEMARGEFSRFWGVKLFPNIDIWGKIFKGPHHKAACPHHEGSITN